MRKKTAEEFIERAREIYGDKYDYSHVKYAGNKERVTIYCKKHGFFDVIPNDFLRGHGCYFCGIDRKKRTIQGVGINDGYTPRGDDCKRIWAAMLARCYNPKNLKRNPTYGDVNVCDDWKVFSNFSAWFKDNYRCGYQLDKDIICKHNKTYAPDRCCFVPQEINKLLVRSEARRGDCPIGVSRIRRTGMFVAHLNICGEMKRLGAFNTKEDAFLAYKEAKEAHIKQIAQDYYERGEITKRVYDALMRYEVEITD